MYCVNQEFAVIEHICNKLLNSYLKYLFRNSGVNGTTNDNKEQSANTVLKSQTFPLLGTYPFVCFCVQYSAQIFIVRQLLITFKG